MKFLKLFTLISILLIPITTYSQQYLPITQSSSIPNLIPTVPRLIFHPPTYILTLQITQDSLPTIYEISIPTTQQFYNSSTIGQEAYVLIKGQTGSWLILIKDKRIE